MITQLAFLDLAAKACPRRVEATFFALLMSVFNGGAQGSQVVGGHLYDWLGYTPLVLISAGFTALAWLLVPSGQDRPHRGEGPGGRRRHARGTRVTSRMERDGRIRARCAPRARRPSWSHRNFA